MLSRHGAILSLLRAGLSPLALLAALQGARAEPAPVPPTQEATKALPRPETLTSPAPANSPISRAMYSGLSSYWPNSLGRPAFG